MTDKVSSSEISFNDELTWHRLKSDLEESRQYTLSWTANVRNGLDALESLIVKLDDAQTECTRSFYISDIESTLQHIDFLLKLRHLFGNRKKITATVNDVTSIYSIEELTLLTKLMFVSPEVAKLDENMLSAITSGIQKATLALGTSCISDEKFRQLVHFHYTLSEHGKVVLAAFLQSHSSLVAEVADGMTVWREFRPVLKQLFDLPLSKLAEPSVSEDELVRQTSKRLIQLRSIDVPKMVTIVSLYPAESLMVTRAEDIEWRLEKSDDDDKILF